jgi:hypothetical protein
MNAPEKFISDILIVGTVIDEYLGLLFDKDMVNVMDATFDVEDEVREVFNERFH